MAKLVVTGRLVNRNETTKQVAVHVDQRVLDWIESNVSGNKQVAYNHLLMKGIEAIDAGDNVQILEGLPDPE
ncbi:hypothetical protein QKW35_17650 [Pontibacterium granulatum]|uniref:hypothetical protein n=1 Tax=Pontibacterium granulatum TaxID=2036029 RepID=UPI00249C4848|nr:hypothetical protein [Pontibacterium granulatum]MDI3326209.1 hypothetical protein [Pontibacterium granulatum]